MALSIDDQVALRDLYARYCHAIDDGDSKAFVACFTEDGSLEVGRADPIAGVDALNAFAEGVAQGAPGLRHQITNITLEGTGDDATGRAYLSVYRVGANGHEIVISGRYVDTLRKVDGEWRYARRQMTPDAAPAG